MSTLGKNSIITLASNIVMLFIGMISSIIIARVLGPKNQGIYSLVILIPNIISTFLIFGVDVSSIYQIGKEEDKKEKINFFISLAVIISLVSLIISFPIVLIFKDILLGEISINYVLLALTLSPIMVFNQIIGSIFKGLEDFYIFNMISIIQKVLFFLTVLLLFITPKLNIVIIGLIMSSLFQTTYLLIKLKNINNKFKFVLTYKDIKESLSYGIKVYLSNLITFLNYRFDIIIMKTFLPFAQIGYYSVAVSIVEKLWIVSTSISTVIFPRLSGSKSNIERNNITGKMTRIVFTMTLIISIILFLLSDFLIPLLFSKDYVSSVKPLKILLVGIFFLSFSRVLSNDISARGYPQINTVLSFINLLINISLNILLIPRFGSNGAAIATSISYTSQSILTIIMYLRLSKNKLKNILLIKKSDISQLLRYKSEIWGRG